MTATTKLAIPLLLLAASAATAASPDAASRAEAQLAKELLGRTAGAPVDCISFNRIKGTEIIDGTAILYRTAGGRIYLNRPNGADVLRDDDVMVTRTSLSQLCRMDTIHLFDRGGQFQRGFVGLGEFVPYEKPAKAVAR